MTDQEVPEVDVEQIMREIREQIKAEGHESVPDFSDAQTYTDPVVDPKLAISIVPPDDGIMRQFSKEAQVVLTNSYVPYYRELGAGFRSLVKRVVRKANKSLVFPMSEEQNDYNLFMANGLNTAHKVADYHQIQLNSIQRALNDLNDRLDRLEQSINCNNPAESQDKPPQRGEQ